MKKTESKYIYKYLPINEFTLRTLINNELYFSKPFDFNDPLDSYFKLKIKKGSTAEKSIIDGKLDKEQRLIYEQSNSIDIVSDEYEKVLLDKFNKIIGLSCFTETNDNFLMWSHYAKSHQGICLKFDWKIDEPFFQGDKVEYKDELLEISFSDIKDLEPKIDEVIYTKLTHWEKENEIRATKQIQIFGKRTFNFNPKALVGVIIGAKTKSDDIALLKKIVASNKGYQNLKFYKSTLQRKGSGLKINVL